MERKATTAGVHSTHHEHRNVSGGVAHAAVFGVSDGLVSNISLILGIAGSGVDASVVRLAGIAGLLAGAFSMGAGEYVSMSAQNELIEREIDVERRELARNPEAETAELSRMYIARGVSEDRANEVAADIMRDPDTALEVHTKEELGVGPHSLASPLRPTIASFLSFSLGALLPLLPWFVASGRAATAGSIVVGIVAATVVGAMIGRFSEHGAVRGALRQVAIMLVACAVTYGVGAALGVTVT